MPKAKPKCPSCNSENLTLTTADRHCNDCMIGLPYGSHLFPEPIRLRQSRYRNVHFVSGTQHKKKEDKE